MLPSYAHRFLFPDAEPGGAQPDAGAASPPAMAPAAPAPAPPKLSPEDEAYETYWTSMTTGLSPADKVRTIRMAQWANEELLKRQAEEAKPKEEPKPAVPAPAKDPRDEKIEKMESMLAKLVNAQEADRKRAQDEAEVETPVGKRRYRVVAVKFS